MQKIYQKIILGVIIVASFIYVLFLYSLNQKNKLSTNESVGVPSGFVSTLGWSSYNDTEFPFEIKYPSDWKLSPDTAIQNTVNLRPSNNSNLNLKFINISQNSGKQNVVLKNEVKVDIKINNVSAVKRDGILSEPGLPDREVSIVEISNNNKTIVLSLFDITYELLFSQIISTLKFTK